MQAALNNEFKNFFGFGVTDEVLVTSTGLLQVNGSPFVPGSPNNTVYAGYKVNEKVINVSRIIYAAFHPEAIEIFRQGCRVNLVRPLRLREGTSMARNFLEDLILEPLSIRPERPLNFDSEGFHPVGYGPITYGVPYPLMFKNKTDTIVRVPNYAIEFYDNINTPCLIYHQNLKVPLRLTQDKITAKLEGSNLTMAIHVLILSSAFPDIDVSVKNTVDHINNDCTDHRITNLQWLTRSENSSKSSQAERSGRPIMMLKRKGDDLLEVCRFKSQYEAARLIKKYHPPAGTVKSIASKFSRNNLHKPHYNAYNFVWRDVPVDIEGEVWKDLPGFLGVEVNAYQVSNKGRVRNTFGYLFRPVPNRHGKYTSVSLLIRRNSQETRRFYIHFLVFCAFNNRLPEGDVCHYDSAPLVNGYYRNYVEDLRDGSRTENMYEHHGSKRQRLTNAGGDSGPTDSEIYDIEDIMSDKAAVIFNENTFHQQGWVYADLEDEVKERYAGDEQRISMEIVKIRQSKILKVRRDYPFELNFYKPSGGKGCMFTSTAFGEKEVKGPCNQGISANVKVLHIIYCYLKLVGDRPVNFAELFEELSQHPQEVQDLDRVFHIVPSRGPNVLNTMLKEKGLLPERGFFTKAAAAKSFSVA